MSVPAVSAWPALREAARSFCPPFEVAAESPRTLSLVLRHADADAPIRLRYRSERGLFLRTYYLVIEAEVAGEGPEDGGELVLRRRRLRWKRPKPRGGKAWGDHVGSEDVRRTLRRLQVERLGIGWAPERATWNVSLETLSGSLTVTFFPPLATPNPLLREEAEAFLSLLGALTQATSRRPA